jgi:hypothetical protein
MLRVISGEGKGFASLLLKEITQGLGPELRWLSPLTRKVSA